MRRLLRASLAVAVTAALLTGCAAAPDVSAGAAEDLQASVQQVATLASTGDHPSALAELDTLQSRLDAAVADDEVSDERSASIRAAIELVRADLATEIAVAEARAAADAAAAAQAAADAKAAADAQAAADARLVEEQRKAAEEQKRKDDEKKKGPGKDDDDD
jgi:hypothetical protein